MKDFPYDEIYTLWYEREDQGKINIFKTTIADLGLKGDKAYLDHLAEILGMAANVIRQPRSTDSQFRFYLNKEYMKYFQDTPMDKRATIEVFDNYLYHWANKVWPRALDIIRETCRQSHIKNRKEN